MGFELSHLLLPMKNIQFVVSHGIDLFLKDWHWDEMSGRVQQQTAVLESREIPDDGRIVDGKLKGKNMVRMARCHQGIFGSLLCCPRR